MPSTTSNQHSPLLLATDASQTPVFETLAAELNPLRHSPYGTRQGERAPQGHLGFNGQLREQPSGWYYLGHGHRLYNPVLRRFHSPDGLSPFGAGGLNPYAYCQGDPVNFTDPSGREVQGTHIMGFVLHGLLLAMGGASLFLPRVLQGARPGSFLARYRDRMPQIATATGGLDRVGTVAGMLGSVAAIGAYATDGSDSGEGLLYSAAGIGISVAMVKGLVLATPMKDFTSTGQKKFATFVHGRKAIKMDVPRSPMAVRRQEAPSIEMTAPSPVREAQVLSEPSPFLRQGAIRKKHGWQPQTTRL